jgi:hypothetical protein
VELPVGTELLAEVQPWMMLEIDSIKDKNTHDWVEYRSIKLGSGDTVENTLSVSSRWTILVALGIYLDTYGRNPSEAIVC